MFGLVHPVPPVYSLEAVALLAPSGGGDCGPAQPTCGLRSGSQRRSHTDGKNIGPLGQAALGLIQAIASPVDRLDGLGDGAGGLVKLKRHSVGKAQKLHGRVIALAAAVQKAGNGHLHHHRLKVTDARTPGHHTEKVHLSQSLNTFSLQRVGISKLWLINLGLTFSDRPTARLEYELQQPPEYPEQGQAGNVPDIWA